jgi:hypothetical protein
MLEELGESQPGNIAAVSQSKICTESFSHLHYFVLAKNEI